jgi:hypothetical protein
MGGRTGVVRRPTTTPSGEAPGLGCRDRQSCLRELSITREAMWRRENGVGPVPPEDDATHSFLPLPERLPPGWIHGSAVTAPDRELLTDVINGYARTWQTTPAVAATMLWKRYTYWIARPAVTAWALHRQVPDLSLTSVGLHFPADAPYVQVRPVRPGTAVLPDDPQAGRPETVVVPDEDALLSRLRVGVLDEHLVPVAQLVRPVARCSMRSLQGSMVAGCAVALAEVAYEMTTDAFAALDRMLAAFGRPYQDLVEIIELVDQAGRCRPFPMRRTCCRAFRSIEGSHCGTCSLLGDAGRQASAARFGAHWRPRNPAGAPRAQAISEAQAISDVPAARNAPSPAGAASRILAG